MVPHGTVLTGAVVIMVTTITIVHGIHLTILTDGEEAITDHTGAVTDTDIMMVTTGVTDGMETGTTMVTGILPFIMLRTMDRELPGHPIQEMLPV